MKIKEKCLAVSMFAGSLSVSMAIQLYKSLYTNTHYLALIAGSLLCVLLLGIALLFYDIYRHNPSASHTYSSLCDQYVNFRKCMYYGYKVYKGNQESFQFGKKFREETLLKILENAKDTMYARDKNLNDIKSVEEFRKKIPISTYEDYIPYVTKVLDGEPDVLFPGKPLYLGTTSGTTGKYKVFPKSIKYFNLAANYMLYRTFYVVYKNFPSCALKKILTVQTFHKPTKVGNCLQGPVTAAFASHKSYHVLPHDAYFLSTNKSAQYITLLFALRERDIGIISSYFSSPVLVLFQKLELDWKEICNDIEMGRIRDGFEVPDDKVAAFKSLMPPDPKRASELRKEFEKGFQGIAKRIWPGVEMSLIISTGVFKASGDILKQTYLCGITNFSRMHGGTEGGYGIAHKEFGYDPEYIMINEDCYLELLPVDIDGDTESKAIFPMEAEVGKRYEILLTCYDGLYRYRTTDVIEATGFMGESLIYKFSQRIGECLYLINEKTPVHVIEKALYTALHKLKCGGSVSDYCCSENVNVDKITGERSGKLSYQVFLEMNSNDLLPANLADEVENGLIEALDSYRRHRLHETADRVKIFQVKCGTFDEIRALTLKLKETTAVDQYKAPRVTRDPKLIEILVNNKLT